MVILDLDDFAADQESNALDWLVSLKYQFPKFKVTLFTILGRWNLSLLKKIKSEFDWIELAAHGWLHQTNDEVMGWTQAQWYHTLNKYEKTGLFVPVFKAPNWEMTRLGYHVLQEFGWAVAIRKQHLDNLPKGIKYYCFETNIYSVHGHTWTMPAHKKEGMFTGWSESTNFEFVSKNLETR